MRHKYLYRVVSTYPHGGVTVYHFQTKKRAEASAKRRRKGFEYGGDIFTGSVRVEPALSVVVERSNPITWPAP